MTAGLDSLMMNGGYNSFLDPAWQQYWAMSQQMNAQNYAQQLAASQAATTQPTTVGAVQAGAKAASSPSFQGGAIARAEEPKKGGNGKAIGLTIGALAVAGTAFLASRGKSAGAKGLWNQISTGFKSLGKNKATQESAKLITGTNKAGQRWVEIPGTKAKNITCTNTTEVSNAVKTAETLGHDVQAGLQWTDEAAELNGAIIKIRHGGQVNTVRVNKSGYTIRNGKNDVFTITDQTDPTFVKMVEDAISALKSKGKTAFPKNTSLERVTYTNKEGSAIYRNYFKQNKGKTILDSTKNNDLHLLRTRRYNNLTDEAVIAARSDAKVAAALDELKAGKLDSFNIAYGEYVPAKTGWFKKTAVKGAVSGQAWDPTTKIVIRDGKVAEVIKGGKVYKEGSVEYNSLYNDFKTVFDEALTHRAEFTNIRMFV